MLQKLHKNARTNYLIRRQIQLSSLPINTLARQFGISWLTVKKWKERKNVEDLSSRPHNLRTTLTPKQEGLIIFERKKFKKTVEEIYFSLEKQIPNLYPLKIYRYLKRYQLSVLPEELVKAERRIKRFRKYTIGYLHLDTLFTPKINKKRWSVFTSMIDYQKLPLFG